MIAIIEDGTISSKIAKKVFVHLAKNGGGAREYVEKQVWSKSQIQLSWFQSSTKSLPITKPQLPTSSQANATQIKAFTGFLMKATKGQANPQVALKLLAQE